MDWKRIRAPSSMVCVVVLLAFAAGPAQAEVNSCNNPPPPGYNVITADDPGLTVGTERPDYIVGTSGDDTIRAEYGKDIVCAGDGNDVVYGGGSSDDLHGGDDHDKLFGELLDDELYGGLRRDVLLGGHGADQMFGQEGNDWLRGGTNGDVFDGGINEDRNDNDVASFADTTPTGGKANGLDGVVVNLKASGDVGTVRPLTAVGNGTDDVRNIETVIGSPFNDQIVSDASVRNQSLHGGMGTDSCTPEPCREPSTNLTAPFAYIDRTNPIAIEPILPDPMLIVVGGSADETFTLTNNGLTYTVVASSNGSPVTLNTTGSNCTTPTRGTVRCAFEVIPDPDEGPLVPVSAGGSWFGGAGDDAVTNREAAPNGMTIDLDGGTDDDTITGSAGVETLSSGNSGVDDLDGNGGDDALLAVGSGGDELFADEGNDQLVTSDPCEGHVYRGGPGQDIAGFARTQTGVNATLGNPSGDAGTLANSWYGHAFKRTDDDNNACPGETFTWVGADSEILEGTDVGDVLTGNQNANTIWARSGADVVDGRNGNDIVEGHDGTDRLEGGAGDDDVKGQRDGDTILAGAGADVVTGGPGADKLHGDEGDDQIDGETENDSLWGEEGNDRLSGGADKDDLFGGVANDILFGDAGADELFGQAGNDRLHARDGTTDDAVSCGGDTDEAAEADANDPVFSCNP
ncbi:MAG TPA: calcium-binding protein [Conexibacter sp.]|nr:calcium-binding protein [Conexibacter sp.]